jgi:hypothetical protein
MTPDPSDVLLRFATDFRRVAEARSQALDGHPAPQELVDYQLGSLPTEAVEVVQEHLSLCPECAQVVLDLAAFTSPWAGEPALPSVDLERDWEVVERRLRAEAFRARAQPLSSRWLVWALAASLVLSLGLVSWAVALRQALTEAIQPRADIARLDLTPVAPETRRGTDAPAPLHLGPAQDRLLLLLNLGDLRTFPRYRLELLDATGRVLWAGSGAHRNDDGTFLLEIPAHMLASKVYQVRLYGGRDGATIVLASYSFEVVHGGRFLRNE